MFNKDLKAIIINVNIDLLLKNITKSPTRCARNIIELGLSSTLNDNLKTRKDELYHTLLDILKTGNIENIKNWFFQTFF